ncbi:hypothetical protein AB0E62_39455 [Streptomyces sp. NPDC038707]|uniref:hypothetical protein n=1 Tax=Streptomyces sp. NPDC038707 TaxID=3154329 RepID=UPI0033C01C3C
MSVTVTKTAGYKAEITWAPKDDPRGYLTAAIEGDQLEAALAALGTTENVAPDGASLAEVARHTTDLVRLLERRAAVLVVQLRDGHEARGEEQMSWPQIARRVLGDPDKHSSVRRMYDSGRRHLGR